MYDVSIVSCIDYTPNRVRAGLLEALAPIGGLDWVTPGMKIAVKANLVSAMKPETAAPVHPVVAAELTRLLVERGGEVVVGDSPGGLYNAPTLNHVYTVTGMKLVQEAGGRLNDDFSTLEADFPQAVTAKHFTYTGYLAKADAVIDLCKLKTHGLMAMTNATKNMFGVIPGTMKPEYHFRYADPAAFANMLVDLNEFFISQGKLRLCICDAVTCMEGNGPTKGSPKQVGALLASRQPYALDLAASVLMGLAPNDVLPLRCAQDRGLCPAAVSELRVFGDLTGFVPSPGFVQAGASQSWFVTGQGDTLLRELEKKFIHACLCSRPQPTAACVGCGVCAGLCPAKALQIRDGRAVIDRKVCIRCFCCQEFCPKGAMVVHRPLVARIVGK